MSKRKAETDWGYGRKAQYLSDVRALNTTFAHWVEQQDKSGVDQLWSLGAERYVQYAKEIRTEYDDVINGRPKRRAGSTPGGPGTADAAAAARSEGDVPCHATGSGSGRGQPAAAQPAGAFGAAANNASGSGGAGISTGNADGGASGSGFQFGSNTSIPPIERSQPPPATSSSPAPGTTGAPASRVVTTADTTPLSTPEKPFFSFAAASSPAPAAQASGSAISGSAPFSFGAAGTNAASTPAPASPSFQFGGSSAPASPAAGSLFGFGGASTAAQTAAAAAAASTPSFILPAASSAAQAAPASSPAMIFGAATSTAPAAASFNFGGGSSSSSAAATPGATAPSTSGGDGALFPTFGGTAAASAGTAAAKAAPAAAMPSMFGSSNGANPFGSSTSSMFGAGTGAATAPAAAPGSTWSFPSQAVAAAGPPAKIANEANAEPAGDENQVEDAEASGKFAPEIQVDSAAYEVLFSSKAKLSIQNKDESGNSVFEPRGLGLLSIRKMREGPNKKPHIYFTTDAGKTLMSSPLQTSTKPMIPDSNGKRLMMSALVVVQPLPKAGEASQQNAADAAPADSSKAEHKWKNVLFAVGNNEKAKEFQAAVLQHRPKA